MPTRQRERGAIDLSFPFSINLLFSEPDSIITKFAALFVVMEQIFGDLRFWLNFCVVGCFQ